MSLPSKKEAQAELRKLLKASPKGIKTKALRSSLLLAIEALGVDQETIKTIAIEGPPQETDLERAFRKFICEECRQSDYGEFFNGFELKQAFIDWCERTAIVKGVSSRLEGRHGGRLFYDLVEEIGESARGLPTAIFSGVWFERIATKEGKTHKGLTVLRLPVLRFIQHRFELDPKSTLTWDEMWIQYEADRTSKTMHSRTNLHAMPRDEFEAECMEILKSMKLAVSRESVVGVKFKM